MSAIAPRRRFRSSRATAFVQASTRCRPGNRHPLARLLRRSCRVSVRQRVPARRIGVSKERRQPLIGSDSGRSPVPLSYGAGCGDWHAGSSNRSEGPDTATRTACGHCSFASKTDSRNRVVAAFVIMVHAPCCSLFGRAKSTKTAKGITRNQRSGETRLHRPRWRRAHLREFSISVATILGWEGRVKAVEVSVSRRSSFSRSAGCCTPEPACHLNQAEAAVAPNERRPAAALTGGDWSPRVHFQSLDVPVAPTSQLADSRPCAGGP